MLEMINISFFLEKTFSRTAPGACLYCVKTMLNSAKKDHHSPNYVNGLQNAIILPGSCSRLSNADFEKLLIFFKKALSIN